jgi:hypothetical protein
MTNVKFEFEVKNYITKKINIIEEAKKTTRNLNRMLRDERGMATLTLYLSGCIIEIISCIFPPAWLCCLPCMMPVVWLQCLPLALILESTVWLAKPLLLSLSPIVSIGEKIGRYMLNKTFGKILEGIL